jgi:hypothetical protein
MSATYIVGEVSNFPVKKLEILIKEPNLQILNSTPFLIYTAQPGFTFIPVYAFINGNNAFYTYNKFYFQDPGPSLTQGLLDIQQLNGGVLSGGIYTFNLFVNANSVNGIRSVDNRDLYLKALNTDDLTGTGDMLLTIYYFLI